MMPNTVLSTALARNILRTFRVINQDRNLSRRNRERIKTLYLQCDLGRVAHSLLKEGKQESSASVVDTTLLTPKTLKRSSASTRKPSTDTWRRESFPTCELNRTFASGRSKSGIGWNAILTVPSG